MRLKTWLAQERSAEEEEIVEALFDLKNRSWEAAEDNVHPAPAPGHAPRKQARAFYIAMSCTQTPVLSDDNAAVGTFSRACTAARSPIKPLHKPTQADRNERTVVKEEAPRPKRARSEQAEALPELALGRLQREDMATSSAGPTPLSPHPSVSLGILPNLLPGLRSGASMGGAFQPGTPTPFNWPVSSPGLGFTVGCCWSATLL